MTRRWLAALLGVPLLLLTAAWAVGGAVLNHPPVDLGEVVVVRPTGDPSPSTTSAAPPINPSTRPGDTTVEPSPSPPQPTAPSSASANPAQPTQPPAPTEAATVTSRPAPPAGDDDDDDDGIDDGPRTDSNKGVDPDDDGVDDDTDN